MVLLIAIHIYPFFVINIAWTNNINIQTYEINSALTELFINNRPLNFTTRPANKNFQYKLVPGFRATVPLNTKPQIAESSEYVK